MDILSIIVLSCLGGVLLALAIYLLIGHYCFKRSLAPRRYSKKQAESRAKKMYPLYQVDPEWWSKKSFEKVSITSEEGFKLYGHFLKADGNKLAILVHGYGATYVELYSYAQMFEKRGYSVLAVENRAQGASEGDMVGMGWLEKGDMVKWIEFSLSINPNFRIALFGLSMGAATVCMTLGEKLPNNVVCAISDCGFDNAYRQLRHIFIKRVHGLAKPMTSLYSSYLKRTRNFDLKTVDVPKALKKSSVPVLFIHGDADEVVPTQCVYRLAEALPELRREVYIVKGAAHAMSYPTDQKAYEKRVDKFLCKYGM